VASNFRSVRELMKTSLAAALASLIFAYVTPSFAADPTDARLLADVAMAKATIALLQSGDLIGVRERLHPAIGPLSDDVLGRMSGVVAGETQSVETVSSKGNFSPGAGNRESQTILEYHIGSRWVVANVVVKTENNPTSSQFVFLGQQSASTGFEYPWRQGICAICVFGRLERDYWFDRLRHDTRVSSTFRLAPMGTDDCDARWTWARRCHELEQRRFLDFRGL